MEALADKTIKGLLTRHLLLIKAPIPILLADHLDSVHMLNRSANLLVDLLLWRDNQDYPDQLVNQLEGLQQKPETPALTLQSQLATFVQDALRN